MARLTGIGRRDRAATVLLALFVAGGLLACAGPSATPAAEAVAGDSTGGEAVLPATARSAPTPFRAGAGPDARWGYRTADGRVVIPPRFRFAGEFREGLARVWGPPEPAGGAGVDGAEPDARARFRWGYVAPSGEWAIPPRYTAAADFRDGAALVLERGEYLFIDPAGRVRQRLGSEAAAPRLPLPSASCASLRQYVEELGALSPVHMLLANPIEGESALTLEVRRLRFGAVEVRELGWEGMSRVLVLPGATRAEADAIVRRLLRHHAHREITAQRVFDDLATYELLAPELAAEFLRVRARPEGGFEIHHTQWAS